MKNFKFQLLLIICVFVTINLSGQNPNVLLLKESGKVVIGDTTQISTPGDYNLYVQNGILTERVKVALHDATEWSDDAWDKTPSIDEISKSIENKGHLPDMPSASFLVENGYELKDMDSKLLQQIEWLWQYVITLKQENEELKKAVYKNNE